MRGTLREACQVSLSCTRPLQPWPSLLHSITALHPQPCLHCSNPVPVSWRPCWTGCEALWRHKTQVYLECPQSTARKVVFHQFLATLCFRRQPHRGCQGLADSPHHPRQTSAALLVHSETMPGLLTGFVDVMRLLWSLKLHAAQMTPMLQAADAARERKRERSVQMSAAADEVRTCYHTQLQGRGLCQSLNSMSAQISEPMLHSQHLHHYRRYPQPAMSQPMLYAHSLRALH